MMSDPVALGQPTVGAAELAAVAEVFASGWLSGAGPTCEAFERRFAGTAGTAHAVATSSCGSALHLALLVLGAGPGDEVVVADYTFPATGPRGAVDRRDAGVRRRAAGHLGRRPRRGRGGDHPAHRRHPGRRPVRPAGRLRRAARGRGPPRPVPGRGRGLRRGRVVPGPARGQPRRHRVLQLPRAQGHHRGRGRRAHHRRPGVGRRRTPAAHLRHRAGSSGGRRRGCRSRPSTRPATTTGCRTSQAGILLAQLDRLPDAARRRGEVARAYGELLADLEQVELPYAAPDRSHPWQSYVLAVHPDVDRGAVALRCGPGASAARSAPTPRTCSPSTARRSRCRSPPTCSRATWPSRCTPT